MILPKLHRTVENMRNLFGRKELYRDIYKDDFQELYIFGGLPSYLLVKNWLFMT